MSGAMLPLHLYTFMACTGPALPLPTHSKYIQDVDSVHLNTFFHVIAGLYNKTEQNKRIRSNRTTIHQLTTFTPLGHSQPANQPTNLSTRVFMKRNTFSDRQTAGRAFDGGFEPKQTFDQNTGALNPRTVHYKEIKKRMTAVTAATMDA